MYFETDYHNILDVRNEAAVAYTLKTGMDKIKKEALPLHKMLGVTLH